VLLGPADISQIGELQAHSAAECGTRDSCTQTFLSGFIMMLSTLFVSGLLRPLQKKKRCNNEEEISSYERKMVLKSGQKKE
jgi:hypothetical protein